jgi:hypothetical protein
MILLDMRLLSRSEEPIERVTVEATKSDADDSTQLSEAIEHACPTVFVGRSGVALVLSRGGSGRVVHTGTRPNAAQQAGIEEALALLGEWWPDAEMPKKPTKKADKGEEARDE